MGVLYYLSLDTQLIVRDGDLGDPVKDLKFEVCFWGQRKNQRLFLNLHHLCFQ